MQPLRNAFGPGIVLVRPLPGCGGFALRNLFAALELVKEVPESIRDSLPEDVIVNSLQDVA